ncbi:5407_t:CDS:2, partial [Racocetra fulgida]
MDDFFPIEQFDKVYLVDLCTPLCKIAESRFNARGWSNVYVICDDALSFKLPKIENDIGKIDLGFNGRNHFLIPYLVQIPYYVWLGTNKSSTSTSHTNLTTLENSFVVLDHLD